MQHCIDNLEVNGGVGLQAAANDTNGNESGDEHKSTLSGVNTTTQNTQISTRLPSSSSISAMQKKI